MVVLPTMMMNEKRQFPFHHHKQSNEGHLRLLKRLAWLVAYVLGTAFVLYYLVSLTLSIPTPNTDMRRYSASINYGL